MAGLTRQEIMKIVNQYIGVSGGYLGDFSYRTHADFYPEYCDLDIDPDQYEGTTRKKFIAILQDSSPEVQSKIIKGILQRFPLGAQYKPETRIQSLFDEIAAIANRLAETSPIPSPTPQITSTVVKRAISDTEVLLQTTDAVSGIDRIHTALHGYLRAACDSQQISYSRADSMTRLFRLLRENHPALQNLGSRSQDIERILLSFTSILDVLNPIRNNASVAHPNEELLGKEEAILVINAVRTILHYIDAKLQQ